MSSILLATLDCTPHRLLSSSLEQAMWARNMLRVQPPTELAGDLINGILHRLPVKSNFRFKCVSKEWFALNSETLKHKMLPITMSGLFYNTAEVSDNVNVNYAATQNLHREPFFIDAGLSFLPKHPHMIIYDSCNGLLLCEGMVTSVPDSYELFPYGVSCLYVCNPATTKWVKVPQLRRDSSSLAILDFNPLVSNHFSVIKLKVYYGRRNQYNFEVFSSKNGKWTVNQVNHQIFYQYCILRFTVSFINGLLFAINRKSTHIIGVDQAGKVCRKIDLPGRYHHLKCTISSHLGQSGGSLCYAYEIKGTWYVWKLVNYESDDWVLKSSISTVGMKKRIDDIKFHPDIDVIFLKVEDKVHSYDMRTAQMVELCSKVLPYAYFPYSPCYW